MTYALGIDIGGTKVAMGIVSDTGEVIGQKTIPTNLNLQPVEMIATIYQAASELLAESGISVSALKGVGVGAPGPLDAKNGLITCPPNLPSWINVPIVKELENLFQLPVRLENDANAATLAEKWIGAATKNEQFIYITISTGIGAGIYADGKLFSGARGNAGELGHIVVDASQEICVCGQRGCLEHLASGTAIGRRASELLGKPVTSKEVFALYSEGHPQMVEFVNGVFTYIGTGLVTLINLFDPEKIVIGGGVAEVGEPLFTAVQSYVSKYALNPSGRETAIVPAGLRKDAGLYGAAALILAE